MPLSAFVSVLKAFTGRSISPNNCTPTLKTAFFLLVDWKHKDDSESIVKFKQLQPMKNEKKKTQSRNFQSCLIFNQKKTCET